MVIFEPFLAIIAYVRPILASRTQLSPPKINFHELCPKDIEGVLKNLDFRCLKGHFDVKKANFRGLMAKIGHYWAFLVSRTHLWPIFMDYAMGIVPLCMLEMF